MRAIGQNFPDVLFIMRFKALLLSGTGFFVVFVVVYLLLFLHFQLWKENTIKGIDVGKM